MNLLIDTSTRHLVFAKPGEEKLIVKTAAVDGDGVIDEAVAALFPDLSEVGEIWLGEGPGSFVGLRSSFSYVRMLAMLTGLPCRTFYSSRLWRHFFGVPAEAWFLMRTNARLFYAERFAADGSREARAVTGADVASLAGGEVFCFIDSWLARDEKSPAELTAPWQLLRFAEARPAAKTLTPELLILSERKRHDNLNPLYGHELNFALAKQNG
jgi:tRNA A37 threonylcarbamoyladenosine modification protein TsaB